MPWTYRPELDGLRTVAVYLVLLFHTRMTWLTGGFIGVDVFFVLSGFLVTNVIMAEVDRSGSFQLGTFYARRVRRLLPASVLVIVVTCLLWVLVASVPQRLEIIGDARAALLYVANWHYIAQANDYFATDTESSPFLHFWSLAIEEQFYVFYPVLLLLLLRLTRRRESRILAALAVVGIASLVLQVVGDQVNSDRAYFATETRLYQLVAGAVLAFALRGAFARVPGALQLPRPRLVAGSALVGLVALALLGSGLLDLSASVRGIGATAATCVTIGALVLVPGSRTGRLLSRPTPVYLGKISYGTYLWHWPVILLVEMFLDVRPEVLAVIAATVATALAALSFQLFETPIRTAAGLHAFRWPVVAAGLTLSVLTAAFVVSPVLAADRAPVTAAAETAESVVALGRDLDVPVPPDLDYLTISQDRGPADVYCSAGDLARCDLVGGDGPVVALVGDSHARMFAPALADLAREHGFRLWLSVVSSCPWMKDVYNAAAGATNEQQCQDARGDLWSETLPALDPDVVIVSSLHRSEPRWEGLMVDEQGDPQPLAELEAEGTAETMSAIQDLGARAVVMKSVMGTNGWEFEGPDPLDCLARADTLADCVVAAPLGQPLVDGTYDTAAALDEGVSTVDVNPLVCPDAPACAPMLDGTVVWRNFNHVTSEVLRDVREDIWQQIVDGGAVEGLDLR